MAAAAETRSLMREMNFGFVERGSVPHWAALPVAARWGRAESKAERMKGGSVGRGWVRIVKGVVVGILWGVVVVVMWCGRGSGGVVLGNVRDVRDGRGDVLMAGVDIAEEGEGDAHAMRRLVGVMTGAWVGAAYYALLPALRY